MPTPDQGSERDGRSEVSNGKATEVTSSSGTPNAKTVLRQLRSEILLMTEGQYLGSGEDLCARYAISRPTLHQVARALEHEQLITVRRGPTGGYYARRPSLNAAVASVSTYLRAQETSVWHFITLGRIVHADVTRLAAHCKDEGKRARLAAEAQTFWNRRDHVPTDMLLRKDYVIEGILFDMAANPVVELFMRSMHHFWYEIVTLKLLEVEPGRVPLWMRHRRLLCEALLAGEERIAIAISQSHWDHMVIWLEEAIGPDPERGPLRLF